MLTKLLLPFVFVFFSFTSRAEIPSGRAVILIAEGTEEFTELISSFNKRPSPLLEFFKERKKNNKKVIASLLAFPFPFGIVGMHRIYLGCAPYVPVAYIGSFGGAFGVLPLIDFFVLVFDKDLQPYVNNDKVFMWVR